MDIKFTKKEELLSILRDMKYHDTNWEPTWEPRGYMEMLSEKGDAYYVERSAIACMKEAILIRETYGEKVKEEYTTEKFFQRLSYGLELRTYNHRQNSRWHPGVILRPHPGDNPSPIIDHVNSYDDYLMWIEMHDTLKN